MKKIFVLLSAIMFALFNNGTIDSEFESNSYPTCGIVIEVNLEEDYILIKDFSDNLWMMSDCEDWAVNDLIAMIMYDNNTSIIFDDIIIDAKYCESIES